jgi:hypothetical protein
VWLKTSKGPLISSEYIKYFIIRERKDMFSLVACGQEETFVISIHETGEEAQIALDDLGSKLNHGEFETLNRIADALEKIKDLHIQEEKNR